MKERRRARGATFQARNPPEKHALHLRLLSILLGAAALLTAQESPRPNRVVWFEMLPEPLPDGRPALALEGTSQFLRPDFERSGDGRSFARLDGEEWQLTADLPLRLGPGFLNLRVRAVNRGGGFLDQAFATWHALLGVPQGGRDQVPKYRFEYALVRDGRVVARLDHSRTTLMPLDLSWQIPWGDQGAGARTGVAVQGSPGMGRDEFQSTGGTHLVVGAAAWRGWGAFRIHGQVERAFLGLPEGSPWRTVMARRQVSRVWAGAAWEGKGAGLLSGLGLDLSVGYQGSPYQVGIARVDRAGWQQHWTFSHRRFPRWRFTFSEEAGTYTAPDITGALVYRF
ncbi:MAG: DUF3187 family protein [Acidobacteria bacterium]|nr:DUF3187 family protein [Acidobacteriota bacterium]